MKAQIIYNPTSGKNRHTKEDVEKFVSKGNFSKVKFASTEEEHWERFDANHPDVIFLAGGDGTVHKVAKVLLESKKIDSHTPVHILPMGTANNISKTLRIGSSYISHRFNTVKYLKRFDVGRVKGFREREFFLEAVGAGVFPALVSRIKNMQITSFSKSEEIEKSLEVLLDVVRNFKAQRAVIKTEGITISGHFLLVEVMNIQYIGPNFELAPTANPGDGYFDLVLIPEEKREQLLDYIQKMIEEFADEEDLKDMVFSMRVKKTEIQWDGPDVHVDDELIQGFSGGSFVVDLDPERLKFVKDL
ncbi:diacylglycerol/lipid kinase family protein [Salinimicrobium gaetbulicola]|uniref:Diacylglycerol/lipid kinase family protein n=1 Tax=Salinimicrobium gaetbulicola TaxID=999702 RepID=A0ABW3IG01_9FLAO